MCRHPCLGRRRDGHSARHGRRGRGREPWIGWPAVKAILSTRIVPGLGDTFAAKNAYDAQETDEPADASRPDNLFTTVDGARDAHGRFDAQARDRSLQMLAAAHRTPVAMIVAVVVIPLLLLAGSGAA